MKKQDTEQEKTERFIAWCMGVSSLGLRQHMSAVLDDGRTRAAGRTCIYQKIEIADERGVLSLVVDNPSCTDHEGAAFVATARLVGLAAEKRDDRLSSIVQLLAALSPIQATEAAR